VSRYSRAFIPTSWLLKILCNTQRPRRLVSIFSIKTRHEELLLPYWQHADFEVSTLRTSLPRLPVQVLLQITNNRKSHIIIRLFRRLQECRAYHRQYVNHSSCCYGLATPGFLWQQLSSTSAYLFCCVTVFVVDKWLYRTIYVYLQRLEVGQ